ncbi:MAG TPA: DUF481 domain-containing protein [Acidobacteriaceae bacterium]|nr:DUF481 domain-containing protein [Acidobacteriaceae bacterium]
MKLFAFRHSKVVLCLLLAASFGLSGAAQDQSAPDTLLLADGNTLHGKLVKEIGGTVTFHTDSLGDLDVPWAKVKELHTGENFAVLNKNLKTRSKAAVDKLPKGRLDATSESVTLEGAAQPIPAKDAQVIVDQATLDKELNHEPGFLQGWNGAVTAGATLVRATQNQSSFSAALGLVRTVPTVSWLDTRNRTSADFNSSFGRITQPAYRVGGVTIPAATTKSSILHFDAERDEYLSSRIFALGQAAFDHNYSQDLNLQQIYGGGLGWTVVKKINQEADLKATIQYEKQSFITGAGAANQNLIGSTFSADYLAKLKFVTFIQNIEYIPAYNHPHAWSAEETDALAFPAWKNLGFSLGTLDSYLNDPPATLPPTKRNSFQFTMGLSYAFKSKY